MASESDSWNPRKNVSRMFIRGGNFEGSLAWFIFGQILAMVTSVGISIVGVRYFFSLLPLEDSPFVVLQLFTVNKVMIYTAMIVWVHEMTHMALFIRYGVTVFGLIFPPIGGFMVPSARLNAKDYVVVTLAGPLSGLAGFPMILYGIWAHDTQWLLGGIGWTGINLLNLLPFFPLDGGLVWKEILGYWLGDKWAKWGLWSVTATAVVVLYALYPHMNFFLALGTFVGALVLLDTYSGRKLEKALSANNGKGKGAFTTITKLDKSQAWAAIAKYGLLVFCLMLIIFLGCWNSPWAV
jgi:membrane-associated protease RseP (regulator of RpoE activity)